MSTAASAQYSVTCPVCGVRPFEPCRTLSTHRVTDTHLPRIGLAYETHTWREEAKVVKFVPVDDEDLDW